MNFYDKIDDTRALNGIGSQMNVWDEDLKKYVLLIPLEGVPSVVGSTNTVDVDLLTSSLITKIKGKTTIDDKDQEFLWHRDNLLRLSKYANKQCKFLNSYPDYTGVLYEGVLTYKVDDATSDKLTGTMTIIANKVEQEPVMDVRDLMAKTCVITSLVPSILILSVANDTTGKDVDLVANVEGCTFTATSNSDTIATATVDASNKKVTIKGVKAGYAIITIKCSKENMGSWETTIAVEVTA